MTSFSLRVNVSARKTSGPFASKDTLVEEVRGWLENANEGEISTDNSEYEIEDWEVVFE